MAEMSDSVAIGGRGKVLRRSNSSRLRMHAPSSLQVAPPSECVSEWKVAIPLLSPLDICSLPGPGETAVAAAAAAAPSEKHQQISSGDDGKVGADFRRSAWRHPAEPFCYEPVPSNAPAFAVSHGAS